MEKVEQKVKEMFPLASPGVIISMFLNVLVHVLVSWAVVGGEAEIHGKMILLLAGGVIGGILTMLWLIPIKRSMNMRRCAVAFGHDVLYTVIAYVRQPKLDLALRAAARTDIIGLFVAEAVLVDSRIERPVMDRPILCLAKRPGTVIQRWENYKPVWKKVLGLQYGKTVEVTYERERQLLGLLVHEIGHVVLSYNGYMGDQDLFIRSTNVGRIVKEIQQNRFAA